MDNQNKQDKPSLKNQTGFKNSVKEISSTTKTTGKGIVKSIKELPNLPWDKLPAQGYIALIIALLGMVAIFILFRFVWN